MNLHTVDLLIQTRVQQKIIARSVQVSNSSENLRLINVVDILVIKDLHSSFLDSNKQLAKQNQ